MLVDNGFFFFFLILLIDKRTLARGTESWDYPVEKFWVTWLWLIKSKDWFFSPLYCLHKKFICRSFSNFFTELFIEEQTLKPDYTAWVGVLFHYLLCECGQVSLLRLIFCIRLLVLDELLHWMRILPVTWYTI